LISPFKHSNTKVRPKNYSSRRLEAATNAIIRSGAVWSEYSPSYPIIPPPEIDEISTLDRLVSNLTAEQRSLTLLLWSFAAAALTLAAVGLYGVMSYAVTHRTREIGIRMALGAQTGDVLKLIVRQGLILTLTGLTTGLVTAFGMTRLLSGLLFGVGATDPLTFTAVSLLLTFVALLACWIPARWATKVDPATSLRCE